MNFIWRVFWFRVAYWAGMVLCSFLFAFGMTTIVHYKPEAPPVWAWPCVALSAVHAIIFGASFLTSVLQQDLYD